MGGVSIKKGEAWGSESTGPPDLEVAGSDADLAAALTRAGANPLVRFRPSAGSDLARAVGLGGGEAGSGVALPLDALRLADGTLTVNAVVVGVAPDRLRWWHRRRPVEVEVEGRTAFSGRATTVLIVNGQYLRGADVSPRGHPGDGACEVHVYALAPGQRAPMRARLPTGSHLPHPAITTRRGTRASVRFARPVPLEADGVSTGRATCLEVELAPRAYRLLVGAAR